MTFGIGPSEAEFEPGELVNASSAARKSENHLHD